MNKKSAVVSIYLILLVAVTAPVSALEVIIDSKGAMTFYNDGVLGDSTDEEQSEAENKIEEKTTEMNKRHQEELREQKKGEAEIIKKRQEQEKEQLKREAELVRKNEIETVARQKKEQPLKVVTAAEEKELRIKREQDKLRLEIRQKESGELNEIDQAHPERLRIELMATPREELTEEQLEEIRNRNSKERMEERQARIGEVVELRRNQEEADRPLELQSRDIVAKINQAVEISIDPETNELSVVAPNGEIIKVVHLPDQAITRLENLGSLANVDQDAEKRLELVTTEEGKVVYKMTVAKKHKLLGIFNRQVETEVELDDETGLATETPVKRGGFVGFLDSLTF